MQLTQSNLFKKVYKKLSSNIRHLVNENIHLIIANPEIGVLKVGDLEGVRVHKFKCNQHLYLLAYEYTQENNVLYLIALGEHQNFYHKIKKHLSV